MRIDRLISAIVVGVWLLAVFAFGEPEEERFITSSLIGGQVAFALIAVILIWFGDELGGFTGGTGRGRITQETPGCFVKFLGCLFLIAVIGVWLYSFSTR